jgi:glycosyltransferase involved in cell wall biosynthesis
VIARNIPVLQELLGPDAAILPGVPDDSMNTAFLTAQELMVTMSNILLSKVQCQDLGERCYKRASEFIWPKIVKNFENSYLSAIRDRATGEKS